jgi:hypothetical protein
MAGILLLSIALIATVRMLRRGLFGQVVHLGITEPCYFAPPPGLHRDAGLVTKPEDADGSSLSIEQRDREPERVGAQDGLSRALRGDQLEPLRLDHLG